MNMRWLKQYPAPLGGASLRRGYLVLSCLFCLVMQYTTPSSMSHFPSSSNEAVIPNLLAKGQVANRGPRVLSLALGRQWRRSGVVGGTLGR